MTEAEAKQLRQDAKEARRRRRERIIIVFTIVTIALLSWVETHLSSLSDFIPVTNNVLIFGLININIILIILLIFLIVRNVVKLIYERRHGILGSKLRTKLVTAFVSLSLIPTAVLFFVAINFLSYSVDNWFNMRMGSALNNTLEIAQTYYQQTSENAKFYSQQLSAIISTNKLYQGSRLDYLKALIEQRQKDSRLGMVEIYFDTQDDKLFVRGPEFPELVPKRLSPEILEEVFSGKEISTMQSLNHGDLVSGLAPIILARKPAGGHRLGRRRTTLSPKA